MKKILIAAAAAMLASGTGLFGASAADKLKVGFIYLGPVGDIAKKLMTESKLAYLADAIDSDDVVHMWYVSAKTHEWAEIEVNDNLVACIARRGYDWHFAVGR